MRGFFQRLPAASVLALGLILVGWGGYSLFRASPPAPKAEGKEFRLCPPTIAELLGVDSADERLQGLVVAGIGGVAIWLAGYSLRDQAESRARD